MRSKSLSKKLLSKEFHCRTSATGKLRSDAVAQSSTFFPLVLIKD